MRSYVPLKKTSGVIYVDNIPFFLHWHAFLTKKNVSKLWYLFDIIPHIDFVQMQSSTLLIKRVLSLCQGKVITLEA